MNARNWIAVVLTGALACTSALASAQEAPANPEVARAEAFATEAFEAYEQKEYERAVALYRKALEASPSADIIYNLARIYDSKLKDRQRAIEFYRRYTEDTGADPIRVRIASQRLEELRELEEAASQPPAPKSTATATAQTEVSAPASKAAPPPAASASGLTGTQVAGLITGGAGLAGLGVGIGFGFAAKADNDVAQQLCDGNMCSTQQGVDAAEDASRSATVSTVAFIAGGVLTALGVTLLIVGARGEKEASTASVSPVLGRDLLGAVARGSF